MTDNKQTLVQHLTELRKCLLIILCSFAIGLAIAYPFTHEILNFLIAPLKVSFADDVNKKLIYTGLAEAFLTYVRVGLVTGVLFSLPVFFWQICSFISPGLLPKEKKLFLSFICLIPILFLVGASFAYYIVIPMAWKFFISFETTSAVTGLPIVLEAKIDEYFATILKLITAFGLCFQLPVVLTLCIRLNIIKKSTLVAKRHYAIILILMLSAICTPPDIFSMLCLAFPLYLLYEMSILLN